MTVTPFSSQHLSDSRKYQFSRREHLPKKHNALWKIESGVVRTMTWLEDATIVTLGLWGPGDLVGKLISKCDPYQIECLTKVEATLLSIDLGLNREVLLYHLQQGEDLTLIRAGKRVDSMVYKLLTWLAKKFGSEVDKGHLIDLGLTHQDIAELLGITRVTVTRTLGSLEQQGVIQRQSIHRIILQDSEVWHYEI